MIIRDPTTEDWEELKNIHEKFYAHEFQFDEMWRGTMGNYVVIDDEDGEIITAISIRPIAEMVAVTNKDKSPRVRMKALQQMLSIASHLLRDTPMSQLHVFIQDESWEYQLRKHGFKRTVGNALFINLSR